MALPMYQTKQQTSNINTHTYTRLCPSVGRTGARVKACRNNGGTSHGSERVASAVCLCLYIYEWYGMATHTNIASHYTLCGSC